VLGTVDKVPTKAEWSGMFGFDSLVMQRWKEEK
jgi:hypothetical protein